MTGDSLRHDSVPDQDLWLNDLEQDYATSIQMWSEKLSDWLNSLTHEKPQYHSIVLITSGGTTAPVETNTVRFLDNFRYIIFAGIFHSQIIQVQIIESM